MFIKEPWDGQDAPVLGVATCVVCGGYVEPQDLCGYVYWHEEGRMTPAFSYHRSDRPCQAARRVDLAAHDANGMLGDNYVGDFLKHVGHNLGHTPVADGDELIRSRRMRLDLQAFAELLERLESPLLTESLWG